MGLLTQLNPEAIQDGAILLSKLDNNVAPKSYVDTAIDDIKANYATKTYVDNVIEENELITSSSINDLNNRVTLVENGEIGNTFFKSFATLSEYETAVANGEVVYPCVSYITENNVIKFEKSESPYNAIATVTQMLLNVFEGMDVIPLTLNPDYYEIFEVNGEDYLSNTATFEGFSCIPFPSLNLGDTFEIKFKLKDEPQHFVENPDVNSVFLFYYSLSYLEIDESFYNRVTGALVDDTVREYPVGFYSPSVSPDFTCKFKGDYGITDNLVSTTMLSTIFEGMGMPANDPNTAVQWTFQIPSGNETYGNPSDMFDEATLSGATFYGIINLHKQQLATNYNNVHLIIETY